MDRLQLNAADYKSIIKIIIIKKIRVKFHTGDGKSRNRASNRSIQYGCQLAAHLNHAWALVTMETMHLSITVARQASGRGCKKKFQNYTNSHDVITCKVNKLPSEAVKWLCNIKISNQNVKISGQNLLSLSPSLFWTEWKTVDQRRTGGQWRLVFLRWCLHWGWTHQVRPLSQHPTKQQRRHF